MSEPMTSQSAFSFPDPSLSSTQQATFTSFSPRQTYISSEPVTNLQPNPQTTNNFQNQQFQQYHTATLSSNNAKFPYLKKEEYKTETKARTLLLLSLPEDHMADFHHMDDAREIWLDVKARFGGNEESKKIRKTMLKQEFSEFSVSEEEGLYKGYYRALPPSWSQVALTLKTKGGLEYLRFDDLYNKLRSLEIDVKGGSSYSLRGTTVAPTHSAFIGVASTNTKMVYSDQPSHSSLITYTSVHFGSIMEDVDQMEMEELDIEWQIAMLSLRINMFQKKAERKINFNNKDPDRFDKRKARCYNCL
nr:ribonuclease H-like domain-containing protein [Tanacetum cinerariifolium]